MRTYRGKGAVVTFDGIQGAARITGKGGRTAKIVPAALPDVFVVSRKDVFNRLPVIELQEAFGVTFTAPYQGRGRFSRISRKPGQAVIIRRGGVEI